MVQPTRKDKTRVISSIVDLIQRNGGRFIKWDRTHETWIELGEKEKQSKVGHAIRDMINSRCAVHNSEAPPAGTVDTRILPASQQQLQDCASSSSDDEYGELSVHTDHAVCADTICSGLLRLGN